MEKKGVDNQINRKGEAKIQDEMNVNNPENPNGIGTEGIGKLDLDGLLAPLDLSRSGSFWLGSSSSSLGKIKEPTLANNDDGDDKKYEVGYRAGKKINLSVGSYVDTNCFQKNKTNTGNNSIENSSSSLEESVFSIGHILESIVSELDRKTLLACRLVSRRWSYFGSKALQKIVNILMVHKKPRYLNHKEAPHYYFHAKKQLCLEDLIALVGNSSEFPSTSFSFKSKIQGELSPSTKSFFEAHGSMIKKLTFDDWVSLSDVKQLLFTQAPNLQQLFLTHSRGVLDPIDPMAMNYMSLEEKAKTNGSLSDGNTITIIPRPTLANLKVFKCGDHIPPMFIQHILEWFPNLVEAKLPVQYFHLLINPKNRLHLLKKLDTDSGLTLEGLEYVAKHHENNLTLEEIHFRDLSPSFLVDMYSREVIAMCKIWEASSATCQKLSLDYCFDFNLVCGMPELKSLSFYDDESVLSPSNLLEQWSSMGMGDNFPKLTTLNIRIEAQTAVDHFFQGPASAQVLSVKDVYFSHGPRKCVLQRFKEMFPNATFHPFTDRFDDEAETENMMFA